MDQMTLEQAKQILRDNWMKGVECPCCTQYVKRYKRTITSSMARMLINLYKVSHGEWTHARDIMIEGQTGTGDFAKLTLWGLVMNSPNNDPSKRTSGLWMITEEGKQFVLNLRRVRKYAAVFNHQFQGYEGDEISILDALGKKFDYSELMSL